MTTTIGTLTISGTPSISITTDAFTAAENAIATWVRIGSGLDADHVDWSREGAGADPMPTGTYIAMRITDIDSVSDDWRISRRTASGGIRHHIRGTRHPTLELTCRAGARHGGRRPSLILVDVTLALGFPEVAQALRRAGVGVGTFGAVRVVEGRRGGLFDPLATIEIDLHLMADASVPGREFRSVVVTTPTGGAGFAQTVRKPV